MRKPLFRRSAVLALLTTLVAVGACSRTEPSNFYTLSSLRTSSAAKPASESGALAVGVGPITLPQYLDRSQIVTRSSPNRMGLAEFNKWAEPMSDIFARVMTENLSILIGSQNVVSLPRRRLVPLDYQVEIDVSQFDTEESGRTVLAARWSLFGKDGDKPLLTRNSVITDNAANAQNYESVVASMSRTVEALSREIAQAIKSRGT